jgi:hypothetical protein
MSDEHEHSGVAPADEADEGGDPACWAHLFEDGPEDGTEPPGDPTGPGSEAHDGG